MVAESCVENRELVRKLQGRLMKQWEDYNEKKTTTGQLLKKCSAGTDNVREGSDNERGKEGSDEREEEKGCDKREEEKGCDKREEEKGCDKRGGGGGV
ncbi:hypothetical protein Pmani_039505 [Petrolisthes manimaculis]|uniref:Uncharacterized protein n=1 Tax=Petrolisthes manimaculis TaxID=1843537 RepID=A0AAE1TLA1_9EUCA|nr:hypothetical protein Pmani_039505 [Petrolisthes manimaculis]